MFVCLGGIVTGSEKGHLSLYIVALEWSLKHARTHTDTRALTHTQMPTFMHTATEKTTITALQLFFHQSDCLQTPGYQESNKVLHICVKPVIIVIFSKMESVCPQV